jgi:hypothetical protein
MYPIEKTTPATILKGISFQPARQPKRVTMQWQTSRQHRRHEHMPPAAPVAASGSKNGIGALVPGTGPHCRYQTDIGFRLP